MALALGEDRDEHVGAGDFLAAGRLDVDDRALDDALEPGGRLGFLLAAMHQPFELAVDITPERPAQGFHVDVAGLHDGRRIDVVDQCEQQMLERGIFVPPLVGESEGRWSARFFEIPGKGRHEILTSFP